MPSEADVSDVSGSRRNSSNSTPSGLLDRSGFASALLVFVLLLPSVFVLTSIEHPSAHLSNEDPGAILQNGMESVGSSSHYSWKSVNWTQFADDQGYVQVIFEKGVSPGDSSYQKSSNAANDMRINALISEFESSRTHSYSLAFDGFSARVRLSSLQSLESLNPAGLEIYPDVTMNASLTESVYQIGADQVWTQTDSQGQFVTGKGVVVAVVDTGVDYTHPDLGGGFGPSYKVIGGYDFYNSDANPMDDNGHGTHVAGIIAAKGGITGVAPDAQILAYKVLSADGSGPMSNVIAAIERAMDPNSDGRTDDHADVISMSLGGPGDADDPACQAVQRAVDAGVVVVVAAGNDGPSMGTVASPGISPAALTVGAVDKNGTLADFSSRGTGLVGEIKPEVSAPGVLITSTVPFSNAKTSSPTGYYTMSGTSMATPHVSGAAALLLQLHPTWTPEEVKSSIVSGSKVLDESLWCAGAGGLWVPGAADATLFFEPALVAHGFAGGSSDSVAVANLGSSMSFSAASSDWMSLVADGRNKTHDWTNISYVAPSSLTLSSGQSGSLDLTVPTPPDDSPEGYFDGSIQLASSTGLTARIPLGFVVLSVLNVHVTDVSGCEVLDPYGGVWVYRVPEPSVAMGMRGSPSSPAPPATFLLPSGDYSVHAIGHLLLYQYSDPYVLSSTVTLPRVASVDIYLRMSSARQLTLDLETGDGNPIYVKDFRAYCRYEASSNVSFHLVGVDYSVWADDIFTLPTSKTIYVSDTNATVGLSIAGYSYSAGLWDFMKRNWQHIYEFPSSSSYGFYIEADADLQYLLAWEFSGIDSATPSELTLVDGHYSVYNTKYDIPGILNSYWAHGGTHQSAGGEANFFVRRDHYTSMNPFFSGMTRTLVVQGVYSSLYFPGSPFGGFFEREFYMPNFDGLVKADSASEVYLPSRTLLTEVDDGVVFDRVGSGPFYPAVRTENTNTTLVLYQPLLRDQSGAKIVGTDYPQIKLYRNSQFVGLYQMAEYMARPDAMRIIDLMGSGQYVASISSDVMLGVNSHIEMELGFYVPSSDADPPMITDLTMQQRFVPGSTTTLQFSAIDGKSAVTAEAWWRGSASEAWTSIPISAQGGTYSGAIQTRSSDAAVNLKLIVSDSSGNYLQYTAVNASLSQVPTKFFLSVDPAEVGFRNGDASVVLKGYLTNATGSPLNPLVAVPLDLTLDGRKLGTILDDYIDADSHSHNGTIQFEWHFNPASIFTGPGQSAEITVAFDLGIYEPHTATLLLESIEYSNDIPTISLLSPANGSLIAAGAIIDADVCDSGTVTARVYLDGVFNSDLSTPWDIDTSSWSEGFHTIEIIAIDDMLAESSASYKFEIDSECPTVSILKPENGSIVPAGWTIEISASDTHLQSVSLSVDGGPYQLLSTPYTVDMSAWSTGNHTIVAEAMDAVGHHSTDTASFEIVAKSLVIALESPFDGSVVHSGVPIIFSVLTFGTPTCKWSEGGVWHDLGSATSISTDGWTEGAHTIIINATDDVGGQDDISLSFIIDNTPPRILLVSPGNGSFVALGDRITTSVVDGNFDHSVITLWGQQITSSHATTSIVLANSPGDGYFSLVVESYDSAGNKGKETFIFALDSATPVLSVKGIVSGDAVHSGQKLAVSASDAFLSYVRWAFDSEEESTLEAPYEIQTDSLSSGWHGLRIVAGDYSGKVSSLDMSIYVDTTPPQVITNKPSSVNSSYAPQLTAEVIDDYRVQCAELYYELSDGSFSFVTMQNTSSLYAASLPPGVAVWDGMTIYVRACDSVGNWAEGEHVKLTVSSNPTNGGVTPTDGGTDPGFGGSAVASWFESLYGIAVVGVSIGMLVLATAYLKKGKKSEEEDAVFPSTFKARQRETVEASMISSRSQPLDVQEEPSRQIESVRLPGQATLPAVRTESAPPIGSAQSPKPAAAPLLDSIPTRRINGAADGAGKEEDVDYGDLIERELIIPGLKRSVFQEDIKELERELGIEDDPRKAFPRAPKKPFQS